MKCKIIESKGKSYVQLPEGLENFSDAEFLKAKDDLYLLFFSKSGQQASALQQAPEKEKKEAKQSITKEEFALLNKVSLIKYSDRTVQSLSKSLNKEEYSLLKSLLGRKTISTSKKNNLDYISFPDELYSMLKSNSMKQAVEPKAPYINIENSFFIIPKGQAQSFLSQMQGQMDKISYSIGSDGNIYIAEKAKAKLLYKKITNELKKGRLSLQEIAKGSALREEICIILLKLLGEEGIVYEPEKSVFELVD